MSKKFERAGIAKVFDEVAKQNAVMGNVATITILSNDVLFDYPDNIDIGETADLEISIEQVGFTTPIEVTAFGQKLGLYVIVSGHRRRKAGVVKGMKEFPCIIRTFKSQSDVDNYVLFANNQRDSAKDPFLYCALYKKHDDYLASVGFKGNKRQEIARRLDLSPAQADRYNALHKVIKPVWVLIKDDAVGLSSVLPMASHSETEQGEILSIMQECLTSGEILTRETVKRIVDGYRNGKKSYLDVVETDSTLKDGISLNGFIMTEPDESSNGVQREFKDTRAAEADVGNRERKTDDCNGNEDFEKKEKKPLLTEEEKEAQIALAIVKHIEQLDTCFGKIYTFSNNEDADHALISMGSLAERLIDVMQEMAYEYKIEKSYVSAVKKVRERVRDATK